MPTYEYECPEGHAFEVFQKMTDEPLAQCPRCGERARRKISGGAGFIFKGDGFYVTDHRSEEYKKKASAEAGGDTSGASTKSKDKGDAGSSSKSSEGSKSAPDARGE